MELIENRILGHPRNNHLGWIINPGNNHANWIKEVEEVLFGGGVFQLIFFFLLMWTNHIWEMYTWRIEHYDISALHLYKLRFKSAISIGQTSNKEDNLMPLNQIIICF